LEAARVAIEATLRGASLDSAARILGELPPAGVEGWVSVWIASLGVALAAAERWRVTISAAERRAFDRTEREEFAQLGRDLAAAEQVTLTLIMRIAWTLDS
jgi:hypothetical protein